MGAYAGPDVSENGLVLALDGANYRSFKGEATTNYYSTPETLTDGRVGTTSGGTYTDFTTGGPSGGRFTRWTNNTGTSGTTAWHWDIGYTNTGLATGQTLTVSFYARCPNGTLSNITLNSPDSRAINATLDSTWRRYSGQIIYGGDYTSTPFFRINRSNSNSYTNGATYDLANIQIEAKSYSTTFTTGTRGTTVATGGGWADLTGNGNNGELVNGVRESADNLGSLSFDGVDDYVNLSSIPQVNGNEITFSVWNYGIDARQSSIIWLSGSSSIRIFQVHLPFSNNNVYFDAGDGVGYDRINKTASNSEYQGWHHWVFTKNATNETMYIYLDGSLWHSGTGKTRTIGTPDTIRSIGSAGNNNYHRGYISNLQLYNRELSLTEVQQNFNALRGRFGI